MGEAWRIVTLDDVCDRITDGAHQSPKSVAYGYPMASVKDLTFSGLNLSTARHISKEDYDLLKAQGCHPKTDDILVAKDGNSALDTVCVIRKDLEVVLLSSVAILRPNKRLIDPTFLYLCFRNPSFIDYLKSNFISGAAIPRVVLRDFKKAKILLPPLDEQLIISSLLGALDDKIELNRQTNEILEALARAFFRDWFVDFGPVRAKAEGRPPYLAPDLWALFPDALDDDDKPVGWEILPLPKVFDFLEGPGIRNWQYTNSNDGTKFINIRCIQNHDLKLQSANRIADTEANGKYKHFHLSEGDIVVSTSGTLGRWALVRKEHLPLMLNTSVIRFRPKNGISTFEYLRCYVDQPSFTDELEMRAAGSVQKNFGPMHLKQMTVLVPSGSIVQAFSDICTPLFTRWRHNLSESDHLSAIRDLLLPKLMSGEIRLRDVEKMVGEAL